MTRVTEAELVGERKVRNDLIELAIFLFIVNFFFSSLNNAFLTILFSSASFKVYLAFSH